MLDLAANFFLAASNALMMSALRPSRYLTFFVVFVVSRSVWVELNASALEEPAGPITVTFDEFISSIIGSSDFFAWYAARYIFFVYRTSTISGWQFYKALDARVLLYSLLLLLRRSRPSFILSLPLSSWPFHRLNNFCVRLIITQFRSRQSHSSIAHMTPSLLALSFIRVPIMHESVSASICHPRLLMVILIYNPYASTRSTPAFLHQSTSSPVSVALNQWGRTIIYSVLT